MAGQSGNTEVEINIKAKNNASEPIDQVSASAGILGEKILEVTRTGDDIDKLGHNFIELGKKVSEFANKLAFNVTITPRIFDKNIRDKLINDLDKSWHDLSDEVERVFGSKEPMEITMFKLDLNTSKAIEKANHLKEVIDNIDFYRAFNIDNSQALDAIAAVRSAINAIPDVTYKDLVYRVKTQASPIRPFSEGMEYVRQKLESLPTGSDYTVRFRDSARTGAPMAQAGSGGNSSGASFNPTINLSLTGGTASSGGSIARELDQGLADLWRTNRSELRRAMTQ